MKLRWTILPILWNRFDTNNTLVKTGWLKYENIFTTSSSESRSKGLGSVGSLGSFFTHFLGKYAAKLSEKARLLLGSLLFNRRLGVGTSEPLRELEYDGFGLRWWGWLCVNFCLLAKGSRSPKSWGKCPKVQFIWWIQWQKVTYPNCQLISVFVPKC